MYYFYVVEIQKFADGTCAHLVHVVSDENKEKAKLKAESAYHMVLASAAVSELPEHAAIMFSSRAVTYLQQWYNHTSEEIEDE